MASMVFTPAGVVYEGKMNGTYAYGIIPEKGVITSINGTNITSFLDLHKFLMNASPNDTVSIVINGNSYEVTLSSSPENSSRTFIGILNVKTHLEVKPKIREFLGGKLPYAVLYLATLFNWLFILNIGIGVANLLPLRPLDGGFMAREVMLKSRFAIRRRELMETTFRLLELMVLVLFFINIFGPHFLR